MMELNSKSIIRLLLGTNVLCLIVIFLLCGEVYFLQDRLSEMTDLIRSLNEKISKLETIQQEAINGGKSIEKGNGYTLGIVAIILGMSALIYFGGIDPGDLGKAFNLLGDQSTKDITSQNTLMNDNLKLCLKGIDGMNQSLLAEIITRTDYICSKLNVVLNSMITKDMNINSILSKLASGKSEWE